MSSWRPHRLRGVRPAYLEVADMLAEAIASGELAAGARLPTVRDLAATLGLASATVLRGYREAHERGLTGGTVGRGTFVLPASHQHSHVREQFAARGFLAPGLYDLRSNAVPAPREWLTSRGLAALLPSPRQQRSILSAAYMPSGSTEPRELREAGVRWAQRCGVDAAPANIMIAAGGQHAIAAALCATGGAGTCIAVPEITNSGVLMAARSLGVELAPVRIDGDGIDPRHLDHICRTHNPAALYSAPMGANPIPMVMPAERRREIVRIAQSHGLWIIEDDALGPLLDRGIPPLGQQAPDRALWLASVSQSLGFGFRLAFARVPQELEQSMQEALRTLAWTGTTPGALLAAQALADGTVDTVIAGRRAAIAERHAVVRKVLGSDRCIMHPGISYVWFETPPGWRTEVLHSALVDAGVALAPAAQFAADPLRTKRGLRISAGGLLSLAEYEDALRRIVDTCAHPGRYRRKKEK